MLKSGVSGVAYVLHDSDSIIKITTINYTYYYSGENTSSFNLLFDANKGILTQNLESYNAYISGTFIFYYL